MLAAARGRPAPLAPLALCLVLGTVTGCGLTTESDDDECAATIAPQVHSDVTFIVMATYQVEGEGATSYPYPDCVLTIRTYKELCEGGTRGEMDFSDSRTRADGTYQFTVGYNLNNKLDNISADFATGCPYLPGFQAAPSTVVTNVTIGYDEARLNGNFARAVSLNHTLTRQ